MQYRRFGSSGLNVSRIGLGCYGMSGAYGAADEAESIATIHRAIDLGVNLLDTSASYGQGHNHRLIGRALRDRRDKVVIHSKTGTIRGPGGKSIAEGSGTPERLRATCEESLRNLGIDCLDVLCMSRVDPSVPIEESVGGMARLAEEGKTRFIGLSECAADTLRRASAVHPLTSLQYEYSLWSRDPEGAHLDCCRALDLALMAYAPLGYGFLTGHVSQAEAKADTRAKFPRFQDENYAANRRRVEAIEDIAASKAATAAQICLAWLLAKDERVFPIPGSKSRRHLEENLAAADIALAPADIAALDAAFPPGAAAGTRYPADGMKRVNL
jgi:aryl-alcohol dehydrogenase-like predicted oxidoreductase